MDVEKTGASTGAVGNQSQCAMTGKSKQLHHKAGVLLWRIRKAACPDFETDVALAMKAVGAGQRVSARPIKHVNTTHTRIVVLRHVILRAG
jgi:hypothetical protein